MAVPMSISRVASLKPSRGEHLREQVAEFEERFAMSSEEFLVAFRRGEVPETRETAAWSRALLILRTID